MYIYHRKLSKLVANFSMSFNQVMCGVQPLWSQPILNNALPKRYPVSHLELVILLSNVSTYIANIDSFELIIDIWRYPCGISLVLL